jgi:hypothetical protein
MLNFALDLEGTFIQNLRAYRSIMNMCANQKMPFKEALKVAESRFPEFDNLQMLELRYEMHEQFCVKFGKERGRAYDMHNVTDIEIMLMSRQHAEFYPKVFFQQMGRGIRMPKRGEL